MDREFELWWLRFSDTRDLDFAREQIHDYVCSLSADERPEFILKLARAVCRQEGLYGEAAAVLESFATEAARRDLVDCLQQLKRTDPMAEDLEAIIIRILACSAPDAYRDLVEDYLFRQPVGLYYSSVMWTLWPNHSLLFGKAFLRQIAHLSPERLKNTVVFQGFYMEPEPLSALKSAFQISGEAGLWERTRDAILAAECPGTTAAQRSAVEQILK